jgi:exosortase/archaeosortase family protein
LDGRSEPRLTTLSGPILGADAAPVAALTGVERLGNTVRFADDSGYLWIEPDCSSLTNMSLALLCWVLFAQLRGRRWSAAALAWCLAACLAVVAVNVARIGLMVHMSTAFDLIHGPVGAAIAGWLGLAAAVGISALGTRGAALTGGGMVPGPSRGRRAADRRPRTGGAGAVALAGLLLVASLSLEHAAFTCVHAACSRCLFSEHLHAFR